MFRFKAGATLILSEDKAGLWASRSELGDGMVEPKLAFVLVKKLVNGGTHELSTGAESRVAVIVLLISWHSFIRGGED